MRRVVDGVWQLDGFPTHTVNSYLADGVLFDCRTRWAAGGILRQLRGHQVSVLALTHAHPDHWGAAAEISAARGIPVACHEHDADLVAGRHHEGAAGWVMRAGRRVCEGKACAQVRRLRPGDKVAGFSVVHTPGHSHGHVVYFRETDGVAVVGDILNTMDVWTRRLRIGEPPAHLSVSVEENRRSILKLLELRPSVLLPGHGPPLHDIGVLEDYVAARGWRRAKAATRKRRSTAA